MRRAILEQWETVTAGELTGPDGRTYRRRTTKASRRVGDELIAAGSPLVLYYWAGGQLDWFDDQDATERWQQVRGALTTQQPQVGKEVVWTGGAWTDGDGHTVLLLTGHC